VASVVQVGQAVGGGVSSCFDLLVFKEVAYQAVDHFSAFELFLSLQQVYIPLCGAHVNGIHVDDAISSGTSGVGVETAPILHGDVLAAIEPFTRVKTRPRRVLRGDGTEERVSNALVD